MNVLNKAKKGLVNELHELREEHNELKALYGKNVNDRKQAEEALYALFSRQHALLSAIPDIIVEVDKNKIYTWANSAGLEFYGEDIIGKEAAYYFEGEQETYRTVNPLFEGSEDVIYIESWQRRKDGEKRLLSWWCRVLKDDVGNVVGALSTARDITDRKQAEKALRESEERFRVMFDGSPIGILLTDIESKQFLFSNPAICQMFGYSVEEFQRLSIPDLHPKDSLDDVMAAFECGMHREKNLYSTLPCLRKDGMVFYADLSGAPIILNGKKCGAGFFTNVTNRKMIAEALKESTAKYQTIFESTGTAMLIVEEDTTILMANNECYSSTGYAPADLIGQRWVQYVAPESLQEMLKNHQLRRQNPDLAPKKYEVKLVNKKGEIRDAILDIGEIPDTKQSVVSMLDITERKQAEEALLQERHLLSTLMDNIPDHIYFKDTASRFFRNNRAHVLSFGLSDPNQMVGKSDFDFFMKEVAQRQYEDEQEIIRTGQSINKEEFTTRNDNSVNWYYSTKMPLHSKDGNIIGTFGISRDITERKQAEEEINFKNEQLIKANAEKDKFFSIIAHDLRSPFNSLLGFTQLLAEELPTMSRDQIQQIVVTMRKSATNLYGLLENLLEWSRLQRGLITFNPEPILLLPKVLADTALVIDSANKKEIEIIYDIREELKVYADENMLGSILRNLASNAVKFTPKGGKVSISAKPFDNAVECSVSDTGIGMNQEMKENLFNIDVNTSRKGTEKEASNGLGLLICKEFVAKHGGKLWVESEEGKGSTFFFTLPTKA